VQSSGKVVVEKKRKSPIPKGTGPGEAMGNEEDGNAETRSTPWERRRINDVYVRGGGRLTLDALPDARASSRRRRSAKTTAHQRGAAANRAANAFSPWNPTQGFVIWIFL
jgi:hypothetical protein